MAWDADTAIPYGEDRLGVEYEISEVDSGSVYFCPNCHQQLSLVLNVTVMRQHFRHHKDRADLDCEWKTQGGRDRDFAKIRSESIQRFSQATRMRVFAVQGQDKQPAFSLRAALPTLLPSEYRSLAARSGVIRVESSGLRVPAQPSMFHPGRGTAWLPLDPTKSTWRVKVDTPIPTTPQGTWQRSGLPKPALFRGRAGRLELVDRPQALAIGSDILVVPRPAKLPPGFVEATLEGQTAALGEVRVESLDALRTLLGKAIRFDLGAILVDAVVPLDTPVRVQDEDYLAVPKGQDIHLCILPPKMSDPELELIPLPTSDGNSTPLPRLGAGVARYAAVHVSEGHEHRLLVHWKGRPDRDVFLRIRPQDSAVEVLAPERLPAMMIAGASHDPWARPEVMVDDGAELRVDAPEWYPVRVTPWFGPFATGHPGALEVLYARDLNRRVAELRETDCWRIDVDFHADGSIRLIRTARLPPPPIVEIVEAAPEPRIRNPSLVERSLALCSDDQLREALLQAPSVPKRPSKLFVRNLLNLDASTDPELLQAIATRARRTKKTLPRPVVEAAEQAPEEESPALPEPEPEPERPASRTLSREAVDAKVKAWRGAIPRHVSARFARQILQLPGNVDDELMDRYRNMIRRAARALPKAPKPRAPPPAEEALTPRSKPDKAALQRRKGSVNALRRGHGPEFVKELERRRRIRFLATRADDDAKHLAKMKDDVATLAIPERKAAVIQRLGVTREQLVWLLKAHPELAWVTT